jgi:hypothetical protein
MDNSTEAFSPVFNRLMQIPNALGECPSALNLQLEKVILYIDLSSKHPNSLAIDHLGYSQLDRIPTLAVIFSAPLTYWVSHFVGG